LIGVAVTITVVSSGMLDPARAIGIGSVVPVGIAMSGLVKEPVGEAGAVRPGASKSGVNEVFDPGP
jgi:hypothetical protein